MIASSTEGYIQQYIDDVLSGSIVTSDLVRLAVQRHVTDMARQSTEGFPYYFDAKAGRNACEFFPMLLRHSIGDFAGLPFDLQPWQMFFVYELFGWKRDHDSSRRYRKFLHSVARKNGKSTLAAGLAIMLASVDINPVTGRPEDVAEVILCATKKEQAQKVIYVEIERMRLRSAAIEKISSPINKQITFSHNQGTIRCVGSDRPYDGLNPHTILMDEVHAWQEYHRKFYDTMQTGSGSRRQPIIGTTTTAGDERSLLWLEEYTYAKGILEGHIVDESVLAYIFEISPDDDPLDEANWIKANPNLGVSVNLDYLRQGALPASQSRLALNRFTRYHCNRLVSSTESAFDLQEWDECKGELSDWRLADAIGSGVDLGSRDDLAAEAQVARFVLDDDDDNPIYRYEIKVQAYIGEDTQRDVTKQPFSEWIYRDLIKKSRFPIGDLRQNLIEKCSDFGCEEVGYDPYNGQVISEDLTREGIKAFRMAQTHSMFNEPIRDFLAALREKRVIHDGNPLLRWCVSNAILYKDRKDHWMFDKKTSGEKIDPIVAVVMAFRVACRAPRRYTGMAFIN